MASYSGSRIASLLCGTWLLLVSAPANAIDAGRGGAASGGATSEAESAETAETAEPAEEEEVPEVAEPRPALEAPSDAPPDEQRLYAVPPQPDAPREGLDPSPGRTEFMRRLRANAEVLERGKLSEPTQVHTQGDVTVLSNVDNVATAGLRATPEPSVPAPQEAPPPDSEDVARDTNGHVVKEASLVTDAPPARPKDAPAPWHWLWILAGVATVLLVPIAMLLTRATRSS